MTYYETPGALLDVGCYMVDFYNEEKIRNLYSAKFSNIQKELIQNYLELKSTIGELPEELHPFAYYDDHYYSAITSIIYDQPMETLNFEGFLDYLGSDSFKLTMYNHWLGKHSSMTSTEEISRLDILSIISTLNIPAEIQYRLTLFFNRFDEYRAELIWQFKRIYPIVTAYRKQNQHIIESCKVRFDNEFFLQHIVLTYDTDVRFFNYTLAFENSIHYYVNRGINTAVLGVLCDLQFHQNTDIKTFSYTFQKPETAKIVKYLADNSSVSFSALVTYMGIGKGAVSHYLNDLMGEGVIINDFSSGKRYISLNKDYFKNLPGIYKQAFSKLFGVKKEEA